MACSEDTPDSDGIPQGEIELTNSSPQRISDDIILELTEVADTRCPVGVVCSSAGSVELSFIVYHTGGSYNKTINFNPISESTCDTIQNLDVCIKEVLPYRYVGQELQLEDYRVIFEVEKAQ
ncbi:MAG: hypothetical protein JXR50_03505 [Prolixibacteraceae bacterium]|nr:hypothetical protein [Prolixibacteraceae bacterium]MBN2648788.1 hypothetical protein [Prolixibacteraceae bacterium]